MAGAAKFKGASSFTFAFGRVDGQGSKREMTAQLGLAFRPMRSWQLPAIPMQACPRPLSHQDNPAERKLTAACMTNITRETLANKILNNGDVFG